MGKIARRRDVDVVIISDVHLGTYGCHANELLFYLKSINPKKLILNGLQREISADNDQNFTRGGVYITGSQDDPRFFNGGISS